MAAEVRVLGTEERFGIVQTEDSQMENHEVEGSHLTEEPQFNVSHGQEVLVDVSRGEEGEEGEGEEEGGEEESGDPQQMEQVLLRI